MIDRRSNSTVLIASEDAVVTDDLRDALSAESYDVRVLADRAGVVYHARTANPDLLLLSTAIAGSGNRPGRHQAIGASGTPARMRVRRRVSSSGHASPGGAGSGG